ncbi:MAG: YajG family lipoprotein [Verrucomicrobiota bacterium]
MTTLIRLTFLAVVPFYFSGCAWAPQKLTIRAQPQFSKSAVGDGTTVAVLVVDARPSALIGYRGLDSQLAKIQTEQDVVRIVQNSLIEGLKGKGFNATPYDRQSSLTLRAEIRQIEYSTSMDMWKGSIHAKAVVAAYSKKADRVHDRVYRVEKDQAVLEAPSAQINERLINSAISEVLERIVEDQNLTEFLAH